MPVNRAEKHSDHCNLTEAAAGCARRCERGGAGCGRGGAGSGEMHVAARNQGRSLIIDYQIDIKRAIRFLLKKKSTESVTTNCDEA